MWEILPINGILSSQRGLVDFRVGRTGGDPTEIDALYAKGIAGAEHGSYIIQRPDIV
jgi:hypothetical protein